MHKPYGTRCLLSHSVLMKICSLILCHLFCFRRIHLETVCIRFKSNCFSIKDSHDLRSVEVLMAVLIATESEMNVGCD